jgi:hypothetical protein
MKGPCSTTTHFCQCKATEQASRPGRPAACWAYAMVTPLLVLLPELDTSKLQGLGYELLERMRLHQQEQHELQLHLAAQRPPPPRGVANLASVAAQVYYRRYGQQVEDWLLTVIYSKMGTVDAQGHPWLLCHDRKALDVSSV